MIFSLNSRSKHAVAKCYSGLSPATPTCRNVAMPTTRYLTSYTPADKLKNMDAVARQRTGKPWPGIMPADSGAN